MRWRYRRDGGTILQGADFGLTDGIDQRGVIHGHGHLGKALASEQHQTDVIVVTPAHKLGRHFLGTLEAVRIEILGEHTRGHVHGDDDICTLDVAG